MSKPTPSELIETIRHVSALALEAVEADTLEEALQKITDTARDLIGARYAALGVPNQKGGLRFFTVSGISPEQIQKIDHLPVGVGLIGEIMQSRTALRLADMSAHPQAAGFPEGHPPMRTLLGMPIQIGKQLFGTFYLADKLDGSDFDEEDTWLLETLANSAALAIASARFREQQQQIALLRERERIAMELHDTTIQSLYALGLGLDMTKRKQDVSPAAIQASLDHINSMIEDIRGYILEIDEENSPGKSLRAELQEAVSDIARLPNLAVDVDASGESSKLSPKVLSGVKSILHECVSNVIRHAEANRVRILAVEDDDQFFMTVVDDGTGFDVNRLANQQGLGLQNIRRRIRLYGGTLDIESKLNVGTTVSFSIPFDTL